MTKASNKPPVARYDFPPGSDGREAGKHFREAVPMADPSPG